VPVVFSWVHARDTFNETDETNSSGEVHAS